MMYTYESRPSRLANYPYLCIRCYQDPDITHLYGIYAKERQYCLEQFGSEGTKNSGRWHDGLLGFYFNNRSDAVQFILRWG